MKALFPQKPDDNIRRRRRKHVRKSQEKKALAGVPHENRASELPGRSWREGRGS